jgi:hypothetical protein
MQKLTNTKTCNFQKAANVFQVTAGLPSSNRQMVVSCWPTLENVANQGHHAVNQAHFTHNVVFVGCTGGSSHRGRRSSLRVPSGGCLECSCSCSSGRNIARGAGTGAYYDWCGSGANEGRWQGDTVGKSACVRIFTIGAAVPVDEAEGARGAGP